jgi:hypothetical protein
VEFRLGDPVGSSLGDSDGRAVVSSAAPAAAVMPIAPVTVVAPAAVLETSVSVAGVAPPAEFAFSVAVAPTGTLVASAALLAPAIAVVPPDACSSAP